LAVTGQPQQSAPHPRQPIDLGQGDADDIWLQPHSDDICFSLGLLAAIRRAGTLLTVFPVSNYTAAGLGGTPAELERITRLRLAEDAAFATNCGLTLQTLGFVGGLARGQPSFDASLAPAIAAEVERGLLLALLGPTLGLVADRRRWLFCPMGIGGHIDHLAVLGVVLQHHRKLTEHYRIGFYEDLHYASDPTRREAGVQHFAGLLHGLTMQRRAWTLDAAQQAIKLRLVRLYGSQLTPAMTDIAAYTPAVAPGAPPHEAIWATQADLHQASG
jgi:hypothetical protein